MIYDVFQEKRGLILEIVVEHGIKNVRVFGSVSSFENRPESDLDLLVDFEDGRRLFDFKGLWNTHRDVKRLDDKFIQAFYISNRK